MNRIPSLIVMLTYNDRTVENAQELFRKCSISKAEYWGFKESPLPAYKMKELCWAIRESGKTAVQEVVAYTEDECVRSAETAAECGFDILMGTVYSERVHSICNEAGMKYMPFAGNVSEVPSILEGSAESMIAETEKYLKKGVFGVDLLGYRYTGNAPELIRRFTSEISAPVCIAGSVNSFERIDEIISCSPWAFTIGSAFFDNCFGDDGFSAQVDRICSYLEEKCASKGCI